MVFSIRARAVLIPAAVFQTVIFGGAYGSGREIAEFVSHRGPVGGLLELLLITLVFATVLILCFELARVLRTYDYRSFFHELLGRGWIAYEIMFIVAVPLVFAVNGAAAGEILTDQLGAPDFAGVIAVFMAVVALNYFGRNALQGSMLISMAALLVILGIVCAVTFEARWDSIAATFSTSNESREWSVSGFKYALYNVAVIPIILYSARDLTTRTESIVSGMVGAIAGVFPALVFHLVFMAAYPAILDVPLPVYQLIGELASPFLFHTYILVLFLMIVLTVAGLLQGLIERLDVWHLEIFDAPVSAAGHALIAAMAMIISLMLSRIGITALIANGYSALAWIYLFIFVIPLFVAGPRLIRRGGD